MNEPTAVAFLFLLGLAIGSFLTVVAHRLPRGESIVGGRSHCPACGAQIAAYDNVPVVSWALLRGRARCCGAAISPRYPLTELGTGLLFAATALVLWGDGGEIALGLVFVTMLVAITLTDLERRIIPNKVLIAGAIAALAIVAVSDPSSLPERALAAAAAGGLLLAAALAYPRGMGLGDVKLAATMGLFLGRAVGPGDPRRPARRVARRPGDDRPPRRRGAQAGDPLRPLPRARRRRRPARRRRAGRLVPGRLLTSSQHFCARDTKCCDRPGSATPRLDRPSRFSYN